jgi:hypothetical protein
MTSNLRTSIVELAPDYRLSLAFVLLGVALLPLQLWVGLVVGLFGFFLFLQAKILRLKFTETALVVERAGQEIRCFPYQDWQNWRIFWQPVPILFYFKEVKSIHFLPVIFDPQGLSACLEDRCPRQP